MSAKERIESDFERLSLKKINVTGNVVGKFSTFAIQQEYTNDTDTVLEVTYTFPVSATATVTGFTATIGEKIIKGKVKEKEEAKKEYQRAMLRGDSAYMMTNDESNIFRMNIGKIAIGEMVVVQIDYIDNFDIVDNQIRIIIPTLIPPRYKSSVTDRLTYSNNDIEYRGNVTVSFDKELKIDDIESKTHSIKLENNTVSSKNIKLDRDFVLDVKFAEQSFSKGYCKELPNGNKVVYLSFLPDIEMEQKHTSKNYVFVIDISGSMGGFKLEQTKEAALKCLNQLKQGDRFNIIVFDSTYEYFEEELVEFDAGSYQKVKKYIQSLNDRGGTELFEPLKNAIQRFDKEKIIFLFTDGQVGYESQIAGYVRQNIGKNALFIFGIDSSVNKKGLQEIAEAGRGKAEFIVKDEMIKEIIVRQFARASSNNLFEINLNCKTNKIRNKFEKSRTIFNREFYDVLVETDDIIDDFELVCQSGDETFSFILPKNELEYSQLPLDKIYASEQIKRAEKYIEARIYDDNKGYKEQIVKIAVRYQIDSKYTAFIAVNERDEKLFDIPELQDTVLESPMGWDNMDGRSHYDCCIMAEAPCMNEADAVDEGETNFLTKAIRYMIEIGDSDFEDEIDCLYERIKHCEDIISNNGNYKTLLEEIIKELKPHFSSPDKKYKALFKKMKKKTPKVYDLIKPFLTVL